MFIDEKTIIGFCMLIATIAIIILIKIIKSSKNKNKKNQINQNHNNHTPSIKIDEFKEEQEQKIDYNEYLPYSKKYLLTKNEWFFYKILKQVADELGYAVLSKIRVADLVEVTTKDNALRATYLNKVTNKHIDFVLAKPENLQIVLLIELDDNSHNEAQQERDKFIDALYKQTDYKFIRVRGAGNLKEIIKEQLDEQTIN